MDEEFIKNEKQEIAEHINLLSMRLSFLIKLCHNNIAENSDRHIFEGFIAEIGSNIYTETQNYINLF